MSCLEKIDTRSEPAVNSDVRIFNVPPTNVSNEEAFFREVLPLNSLPRDNPNAPILFRLFNDRLWSDLSRVYLYVKGCIHKQNAAGQYEPLQDLTLTSSSTASSTGTATAARTIPQIGVIQLPGQTIVQQSTLDDTCGFELIRTGTTTLRLRFDKDHPIPVGGVEMIVLGEFDQLLMMDESRRIVSDNQIS